MSDWNSTFTNQVSRGKFVVFLGAGAAASCENSAGKSPPLWTQLLGDCAKEIQDSSVRKTANDLVKSGDLLFAAEHICKYFRDSNRFNELAKKIGDTVEGPRNDRFVPSQIYKQVLRLEPDVVVTTNFDRIFEAAAGPGTFSVRTWKSKDISSLVRSGEPTLIKIHGCVSDASSITLTRSQYTTTRTEGTDAFRTVEALCQTRPVLFIGYRMNDPDIQLLFENSRLHMSADCPHYLVGERPDSDAHAEILKSAFGIFPVYYPRKRHHEVPALLKDLADVVFELRQTIQ